MRNATVHFDDDFDIREPVRKKTARRQTSGGRKRKGLFQRFRLNIDVKRIARIGAIGLCGVGVIGIMVNALVLQKGRHPAPLFGTSIVIAPPKPAARPAAKTVAETPPAPVVKAADPPAETMTETAGRPVEPPRPPARAIKTEVKGEDQIARLLAGVPATPAHDPDTKTVFGAQKALVKLGFVLKPNGVFGPQTKKALEMFEKDRHLPATSELSRRVLKILAAESGLKIEH